VRAKRAFLGQAAFFEVDQAQLNLQLILMTLLHLEPLPPRTTKGEILNLLCTAGGLRREQVGRIDLQGATVAIELPDGSDARVVKALDGISFKERPRRRLPAGPAARGVALPRLSQVRSTSTEFSHLPRRVTGAWAHRPCPPPGVGLGTHASRRQSLPGKILPPRIRDPTQVETQSARPSPTSASRRWE
jgi:hypothetical protein